MPPTSSAASDATGANTARVSGRAKQPPATHELVDSVDRSAVGADASVRRHVSHRSGRRRASNHARATFQSRLTVIVDRPRTVATAVSRNPLKNLGAVDAASFGFEVLECRHRLIGGPSCLRPVRFVVVPGGVSRAGETPCSHPSLLTGSREHPIIGVLHRRAGL